MNYSQDFPFELDGIRKVNTKPKFSANLSVANSYLLPEKDENVYKDIYSKIIYKNVETFHSAYFSSKLAFRSDFALS